MISGASHADDFFEKVFSSTFGWLNFPLFFVKNGRRRLGRCFHDTKVLEHLDAIAVNVANTSRLQVGEKNAQSMQSAVGLVGWKGRECGDRPGPSTKWGGSEAGKCLAKHDKSHWATWNLGGGNSNIFYFHPEPWGNDPIWRAYFSNGLVQPPTRKLCLSIKKAQMGSLAWITASHAQKKTKNHHSALC